MQFNVYTDIRRFYHDTFGLFMCHEAQNLIPLGNIIIGNEGKDKTGWRDPANWFMATVTDGTGIRLGALMTPPHNLTLYIKDNKIDNAVIGCLVKGLANRPIPGVMSEKGLALHFAEAYCDAKGMSYNTAMGQRIYELTEVNPDIKQIGTVRLVEERDLYFLPYWLEAFHSAKDITLTTMPIPTDIDNYLYRIKQKKIYVLEDQGRPVSIAGFTREMQTVCGVAYVYTPPYFRGRGYATSCVAKISQKALERGFKKCVLYTDLANPTSNSIYQKIGYRPICDSVMLKFI